MARQQLKKSDGTKVEVPENTSAEVTFTFTDSSGDVLATADILSMTMNLRSAEDHSTINSRTDTDVLNTGNGVVADVASAAVLTLVLDTSDNANVGGILGGTEVHWLDIKWTWNDGVAVRTGETLWWYPVRVSDAVASGDAGWIG